MLCFKQVSFLNYGLSQPALTDELKCTAQHISPQILRVITLAVYNYMKKKKIRIVKDKDSSCPKDSINLKFIFVFLKLLLTLPFFSQQ